MLKRARWFLGLGVAAVMAAVLSVVLATGGTAPVLTVRDRNWRQDIAYLAAHLPQVRAGGLGALGDAAWRAAAERLEAEVPRLSNGRVIVGMARMIAMLHDDESQLQIPPGPVYPLDAEWFGGSLYLIGVPAADRPLLGARLMAVDGHPIADVMAGIGSVIDYQDPALLAATQAGYLDDARLLYWLGITRSSASAAFTVRADPGAGSERTVRLAADGHTTIDMAGNDLGELVPGMVHGPLPLYLRNITAPYWMQVLPRQQAVYLKYNSCLDTSGFQQLAAQALTVLRHHPGYRLIVDLRDNLGGDSEPFTPLVGGIAADPALNARGRVIGLVNQFTDSSATVDANELRQMTHAVLIGVPPMDPLDSFGNEAAFPLPHSGIMIQYTTARINTSGQDWGMPQITVTTTPAQVMAGADPVLAEALSYGRPA